MECSRRGPGRGLLPIVHTHPLALSSPGWFMLWVYIDSVLCGHQHLPGGGCLGLGAALVWGLQLPPQTPTLQMLKFLGRSRSFGGQSTSLRGGRRSKGF